MMAMSEERHLYVLRHAKSSWDEPGKPDHDRPLAPRGRRAIKVIADYVSTKDIQPDLVLCSTARRTLETMAGVAPAGERLIERPLYDATADQLIERLRRLPSAARSVMVIGHNPAMQMLVLKLASRPRFTPRTMPRIASTSTCSRFNASTRRVRWPRSISDANGPSSPPGARSLPTTCGPRLCSTTSLAGLPAPRRGRSPAEPLRRDFSPRVK